MNQQLKRRANTRKNTRSLLRLKINKTIGVKEAVDFSLRDKVMKELGKTDPNDKQVQKEIKKRLKN